MAVPMPTDLYWFKPGVGQTTFARKQPKKEVTKVRLRRSEPTSPPDDEAGPSAERSATPAPVTPRKRSLSQALHDLPNEASLSGNGQRKRAAKGSEQA